MAFGVSAFVVAADQAAPAGPAEISLEQAVARVQKDTDGRILAAEEVHIGKKKLYRVKVLTRDGRVRVVQTSADAVGAATTALPEKRGGAGGKKG